MGVSSVFSFHHEGQRVQTLHLLNHLTSPSFFLKVTVLLCWILSTVFQLHSNHLSNNLLPNQAVFRGPGLRT